MLQRIIGVSLIVVTAGAMLLVAVKDGASAATTDLLLTEMGCGAPRSHCQLVGNGTKGHFGDRFVFSVRLVSRPDGNPVGRDEGECTLLYRAAHAYYCDFMVRLDAGDVTLQGRLVIESQATSTFAVTGGTGSYEGASGYWRQTNQRVRLHIVTP